VSRTLVEIDSVGTVGIGSVDGIGKFEFSNPFSILGGSMVDNGVEARPVYEFALPV